MGFKFLVAGEKIELGAQSEGTAVRRLGPTVHSALIVEDYGTGGKHEATHRTMMVLKHFNDPALYGLILDDLVKYLEDWTPDYQHSAWLITGSPWQLGLAKVAEDLGKDAKPLIAAFKKCLARIDKDSTNKSHVACRESLRKAIADYEKKFGK